MSATAPNFRRHPVRIALAKRPSVRHRRG